VRIHERLEEMGLYHRMGGTSADYSGSDALQGMVDGDVFGGGPPGSAGPWIAGRVAETARACLSLHDDDQITIIISYLEPLANQALQASALNIKPSALQKRLRRIHLILEDWLTPEAREQRRADARRREQLAAMEAALQAHTDWGDEMHKRAVKAKPGGVVRKRGKGAPARRQKQL